jgi:hypothetical protein
MATDAEGGQEVGAEGAEGAEQPAALTAVVTATAEEDGVTYAYLRVEDHPEGAEGGKAEQSSKEGFAVMEEGREDDEAGNTTTTVFMEASEEAPSQEQYLLQSHEEYRSDLLHSMLSPDDSPSSCLDFPVFCRDGVGWSSRLLLSAMSPMLREALSGAGADEGGQSCLILPDVDRAEFLTFSRALFAKRGDASLDFLVLIKNAEILGANLVSFSNNAHSHNAFPKRLFGAFPEHDDGLAAAVAAAPFRRLQRAPHQPGGAGEASLRAGVRRRCLAVVLLRCRLGFDGLVCRRGEADSGAALSGDVSYLPEGPSGRGESQTTPRHHARRKAACDSHQVSLLHPKLYCTV